MSVLGKHVASLDAALRHLRNIVLDGSGCLVRQQNASSREHLHHQSRAVEAYLPLGFKVDSRLSAGGPVKMHIRRGSNPKAVVATGTTHIKSSDLAHPILQGQFEGGF